MTQFNKAIELDILPSGEAHDHADDHSLVVAQVSKFGLVPILIEENGPAGGCPVYRLEGSETAIRAYLKWYCNGNACDVEYHMESVKDI